MKRLLSWIFLSVLAAPLALATTNYINNSTVSIISPPMIAPQIDASNFVNNGLFYITNLYPDTALQPPLPYETWNTRNWTNFNRMAGYSGFRFDYFDSIGGTNGWSANFQNAGNVNDTNANIFGDIYLWVFATNINNKGTMTVSGPGVLTLNGNHIDLTRGTLGAVGNETNNLAGVRDLYWGIQELSSPNSFIGSFGASTAQSPLIQVTDIEFPLGGVPSYGQIFQSLVFTNPCGTSIICTNGYTAYVTNRGVFFNGAINNAIDVLILRQTNSAITTDVRFASSFPGMQKIIQWQALQTNRVSGAVTTNRLFLTDNFGSWGQPPTLVSNRLFYYNRFAATRFHPNNYSITHAAPPVYNALSTMAPTVLNPFIFSGTNAVVLESNVAWAATITAAAFPPDPTINGATWTNVPGRIEITASGPNSSLELARALIDGESYLLLSSTNHFVGCTNASIKSPVSDVYLSSTNGSMAISNLTTAFVPRMEGVIQAWSGRWTNVTSQGLGTLYTVTMIDSALVEKAPAQIQNLSLRSENLLIGDALNVFGSLFLDTTNLTISTNAIHAPTPCGELNLTSGDLWWSPSLPRLQCLTNYGKISSINSIYFGSNSISPPWFSGIFEGPYQSMVTHGPITSVGCSIWAKYFEASGTNNTGIGPLTLQADSATVTNGAFLANDADITFTCGRLLISNQVLVAGRSIGLTVTNSLDDGSLLGNGVNASMSQNTWTVGGGINLWRLPINNAGQPEASLLATTVTNTAFPNAPVDNSWAGMDKGCSPSGFITNAALGRLILDGQDEGSLFNFLRADPANNAFYIGTDTNNNFRLGDGWGTVSPAIPFPTNGWHHVALVKSTTDTVFYLDGTNRLSRGLAIPNPAAFTGLRLGRQCGVNGEYWAGNIGDVRIWNRALTDAEIQASLTNQLAGTETNLVAAWQFHEGTGATCTNIGATQVVGTLINGPVWIPSFPYSPHYGLSFNGMGAYVGTSTGVIPSSGDFTVECWVAGTYSPPSCREILSQGSPGNALYVDLLELKDATTNADGGGNFVGVNIVTNFTVYYGDAIVAGHSIAEKLNGKYGVAGTNGGRFSWVSNYNTGFFSSTNVIYTDGSVHQLNRALVYSCNIDSNGQPYPPTGGVNATCDGTILKPNPVPVLTPASLILKAIAVTDTNPPGRSIVLTWNTIPLSSNYLYTSASLSPTSNWQLVTSFLSADVLGGQATVRDSIKTNGPPHYYRVRALSP